MSACFFFVYRACPSAGRCEPCSQPDEGEVTAKRKIVSDPLAGVSKRRSTRENSEDPVAPARGSRER